MLKILNLAEKDLMEQIVVEDNNENKYRITVKQEELLNSFQCIRLKDYNCSNIDNFFNKRNKSISDTFKGDGLNEDKKGENAYYVITKDNKIVLFFSIKCGSLYYKPILNIINELNEFVENRGNNIDKTLKNIKKVIDEMDDETISEIIYEIRKEKNKNIKKVSNTYSAIELVHFCSNDNFKGEWEKIKNSYNIVDKNTMGKIFFWYYMVPKIKEINDIIGSKYAYLFAADSSNDETLIRYYEDLNFKIDDKVSTIKPYYDFSCIFMYQEIAGLINKREEYLNRFNEDEKYVFESEYNELY